MRDLLKRRVLHGKGGQKKEREKEGRRLQFLGPLKAFAAKHQKTEKKKN